MYVTENLIRVFDDFTLNSQLTWEEVIYSIDDIISEWYNIWSKECSIDEFILVEDDVVTDLWDGDKNMGKHIMLRNSAVKFNKKNWNEFQMYVNTAVSKFKEERGL